jgi:glucose/arabinose dehydrogenase
VIGRRLGFAALALLAVSAFAQPTAVRVASGLDEPVYLTAPKDDDRLFAVERSGTIRIIENGVGRSPAFLDISTEVNTDGEGGLLGLAFAPDYAATGVFYVYYTGFSGTSPANLQSVVSRFTVVGDPATSTDADESKEAPIFTLDQPYNNHNGGTVAIRGDFLYLALGDGGLGGDPQDRAQDDTSRFGKLLRLDLHIADPGNGDWVTWAKGLRNPFRFGFDRETGDLYIGDVGQDTQEEVDAVPADAPAGLNFGWDVMEGTTCFDPGPGKLPCSDPSFFVPTFTYPDPLGDTPAAVIGGAVYRGSQSPSLRGTYFFADGTTTRLFTMRWTAAGGLLDTEEITGEVPVDVGAIFLPAAIAEDGHGELYVVSRNGQIHRLVPEPSAVLAALAGLGAIGVRARRG